MATVANSTGPTAPPSGPYPSDETILGIFDESGAGGNDRADDFDALLAGADRGDDSPAEHAASIPHRADAANNSAKHVQTTQQGTESPMPEWLTRASAADPAAAPELSALWQRSAALEVFDHAFYSGDVSAQRQLVTQLYSDDPGALRAMVAAANELLAPSGQSRHSARNAQNAPQMEKPGAPQDDGTPRENAPRENAENAASSAKFNPAAYAQFEQATNDAVISDVNRAIERALDRALPNGIADGARKRIAGDTLAEVHTALRGDRQLASQVAGALRNSQFDSATRDAITRLIVSRARGVVPEAARRVIGEWTGSVLASHRERTAKQKASSARVDVIGGALPQIIPQRGVKSTDINYRATSDEDILGW